MRSLTGTFGVITGRVFVSYQEKEHVMRALQAMLISRQFHLQVMSITHGSKCLISDFLAGQKLQASQISQVSEELLQCCNFVEHIRVSKEEKGERRGACWGAEQVEEGRR